MSGFKETLKIIVEINKYRKIKCYNNTAQKINIIMLKNNCIMPITKIKTKYFYIMIKYEKIGLHRFVYEWKYGKKTTKLFICHKCNNPKCINIEHLYLGTPKDNVRDMVKSNRQAKGRHKVTKKQVRKIRKLAKEGKFVKYANKNYITKKEKYFKKKYNYKKLSKRFKIDETAIGLIVRRKKWSWLK